MKTKVLVFSTVFLVIVLSAMSALKAKIGTSEYVPLDTTKTAVVEDSSYRTMMQVLTHERCLNCHPNDNVPKQGDDSNPHNFGMSRGTNDKGFAATKCATCHQKENNLYSGVPGAPHWALAPKSMAWEGLSAAEIATVMLDKTTNGNRSHEDLIHHLTEDELVLWAFDPGVDNEGKPRTKPPVSEESYKAAVKKWFANGALIPKE